MTPLCIVGFTLPVNSGCSTITSLLMIRSVSFVDVAFDEFENPKEPGKRLKFLFLLRKSETGGK